MHCFIVDALSEDQAIALSPEEATHCARVLRLREGDLVLVTDGHGRSGTARIGRIEKKGVILQPEAIASSSRSLAERTALGVALTKQSDRIEWLVEKATEIGVGVIAPLITARTERPRIRMERLQKVAEAAVKQSQRAYLPKILAPCSPQEFVQKVSQEAVAQPGKPLLTIAHCADGPRKELATLLQDSHRPLVALVGPEGDFTPEELLYAFERGYQPVAMGSTRLRTETAALVAVTLAAMRL